MKIVKRIEKLEIISPELANPYQKIYAFKSRAKIGTIFHLCQTPLSSTNYDDNRQIWTWATFRPNSGALGNHSTMRDAFEAAFNYGAEVFEFDDSNEFCQWCIAQTQNSNTTQNADPNFVGTSPEYCGMDFIRKYNG